MKPGDSVTFHQKDLPCTSFSVFEVMRKRGVLCDLIITVQNQTFRAHRMILAAGIPYFQSLYMTNGAETAKEEISRGDLDPKALESLIQFAYTGKVDISFDNVYSLIHASDFFQLSQVSRACVDFLMDRLNDANAIWMHNLAHELRIQDMIESTKSHIVLNFEKISRGDDFLHLPHSCVKEIISEDELNVSSEETVFEMVIKWAGASVLERHESLWELLNEVRMIYLETDYLLNRVASEELVKTSKLCTRLLEDVKTYHLLSKHGVPLAKLKTQPRKCTYTSGGIYVVLYCHSYGYSVHHCDFDNNWISQNLATEEGLHGVAFGVAAVNEKIYLFQEDAVRTFHVRTRQWEVLRHPGYGGMKGAAIVTHGTLIYCFGSSRADLSNRVRCFDILKNKWLKEEKLMAGRFNSAAAALGDSIYITGGFWSYLLPSYMYLIGYSGGKTVERYDISLKRSQEVASMLTPRENHFCTSMNGKIYAFGGGVTNDFRNKAEVYDPFTNHWNFISPIPLMRSAFSPVSYKGKIYAIEVDRGAVCFEVFDSESNQWRFGNTQRNDGCLKGNLRTAVSFPAIRNSTESSSD